MAILTITSQPQLFSWSKNPVEFKLMYTGQITGDLMLQFSVSMANPASPSAYKIVYTGTVRFNTAGYTSVDIQRILDAQLSYFIAQPWDTSVSADSYICYKKQCQQYRVSFQIVYNNSVGATGIPIILATPAKYVAKGGIQIEQWQRDAVYNLYWAGTQHFLNYHNNDVFFSSQGYMLPSFIANQTWLADIPAHHIYFQYAIYYANGTFTTHTIDIGAVTQGLYYVVPFSLYDQPTAYKMVYSLVTGTGSVISDYVTIFIDQRRFNYTKFFAYINSLGGTEWIALPFNQVKATNVNSSLFSRFSDTPQTAYNMVIDTQNFQTNFTEQQLETMDSGALTIKNLDHLRQLVLSQAAFELMTEGYVEPRLKYIPAIVTANAQGSLSSPGNQPASQQPLMDNVNKNSIPLRVQVSRAFNNFSYTPDDSGVRQVLDNTVLIGVATPIEDYFTILINPITNQQIHLVYDAALAFIDYGDNYTGNFGSPAIHIVGDTALKLVTVGYMYGHPFTSLTVLEVNCVAINNLPASLLTLIIENNLIPICPALPINLTTLKAANNKFSTTPSFPGNIQTIDLSGNKIISVSDYTVPHSITSLNLSFNKLSTPKIDFFIIGMNVNGQLNGTLSLQGQTPPAPPSAAGLIAKSALIAKGWTVNTD